MCVQWTAGINQGGGAEGWMRHITFMKNKNPFKNGDEFYTRIKKYTIESCCFGFSRRYLEKLKPPHSRLFFNVGLTIWSISEWHFYIYIVVGSSRKSAIFRTNINLSVEYVFSKFRTLFSSPHVVLTLFNNLYEKS